MKISFQECVKFLKGVKKIAHLSSQGTFIKANKQFYIILAIIFMVTVSVLFCYWIFIERPYFRKLLSEKDDIIKDLKFLSEKQRRIHENMLNSYETKIANEYIPKSVYEEKLAEYKQKFKTYQNTYIAGEEHKRQMQELERRLKEEFHLKEKGAKENYDQKITELLQKISILEDKNLALKTTLEGSMEFINGEKDSLEERIMAERKKALIPSLILPEIKSKTIPPTVLKKLVTIKNKLKQLEALDIPLKPGTYFEMGLISYYNNQHQEAIEQWENAIFLDKKNIKAYLCLGILYHEKNMSDNALKILNRALQIEPEHAILHLSIARIYEQKGRLDDAIYEYSKALEIRQDMVEIYHVLGALYEKKGLKEEARNAYIQYKKLKGIN